MNIKELAELIGDMAVEMTGDDYRAMFDAKHTLLNQQAEIAQLKAQATALGQMLQTCLSLPVRGQPCVLDKSDPEATEYKTVYWMDAVMDCLEANTAMRYDREMAYLSALPPSQYHKAVKKLEKERAAKKAQEQTQ